MKQMKRFVSVCLALMISLFTLNTGFVADASKEVKASEAFSFIRLDGKNVNLKKCPETYYVLNHSASTAKIEWELKDGWTISEFFHDGSSVKPRSGDRLSVSKNNGSWIDLEAVHTDGRLLWYHIIISCGKACLRTETIWAKDTKRVAGDEKQIFWIDRMPVASMGDCPVVSLKNGNSTVIKVKKGKTLGKCFWIPKKVGNSIITIVLRINGENKAFSSAVHVKKYPNALKYLKIEGKKVDFKKYPFLYKKKVKKKRVKLEYKLAKGWKLIGACYTGNEDWDVVDIKSGSKMYATSAVIILRNKSKEEFLYTIVLNA